MSWKVLKSLELFKSGLFRLRTDELQLPDGRVMPRYYVIEFADWVNILPITDKGEAVLVKQYRHASGRWHLEIPGGSMDPHRLESAAEGARREMLEETGFDSEEIVHVGSHYPNPALQNNQMHTFVAKACVKIQEQQLDEFEDVEVYICSLQRLRQHILEGDIDHSLMLASLLQILNFLEQS